MRRAEDLDAINRQRQQITQVMVSEAREQAILMQDRKILVLWKDDWQKGVVGLVAGKIAEEFRKPAIVLQKGEVESTGSARTVGEFNIVDALKHASAHLTRFGGHQQAAGLTLKTSEYEAFYAKLLEYAEAHLAEEDAARRIDLEAELAASDLKFETLDLIIQFEPFGVDNVRPRFLVRNLAVENIRMVGSEQQHAQLQLAAGGAAVSAIAFNFPGIAQTVKIGDTVEAAVELMEDGWNGQKRLKLRIIDMRAV
jgi:single-stranded-DNA-specific exonuclease